MLTFEFSSKRALLSATTTPRYSSTSLKVADL